MITEREKKLMIEAAKWAFSSVVFKYECHTDEDLPDLNFNLEKDFNEWLDEPVNDSGNTVEQVLESIVK